jgi:hypothetical protein
VNSDGHVVARSTNRFIVNISLSSPSDYHPDLGMECADRFVPDSPLVGTRWRGLRFENARYKKELTQANTLYVKVRHKLD